MASDPVAEGAGSTTGALEASPPAPWADVLSLVASGSLATSWVMTTSGASCATTEAVTPTTHDAPFCLTTLALMPPTIWPSADGGGVER